MAYDLLGVTWQGPSSYDLLFGSVRIEQVLKTENQCHKQNYV